MELSFYIVLGGFYSGASLMAQMVESACNVGDWIQSLGQQDPLEKGMATHSGILAWRIP